jgi:hypothetical protein
VGARAGASGEEKYVIEEIEHKEAARMVAAGNDSASIL